MHGAIKNPSILNQSTEDYTQYINRSINALPLRESFEEAKI
jgi:hypothetical protein